MPHETEIQFFKKLLENLSLPVTLMDGASDPILEFPPGLRFLLKASAHNSEDFLEQTDQYAPNVIYRIFSEYFYQCILFRLPEYEPDTFVVVGPYMTTDVSKQMILDIVDKIALPADHFHVLEKFYQNLPLLYDEGILLTIVNTLAEQLWGSMDNFCLQDVRNAISIDLEPLAERPSYKEQEEAIMTMKVLEERYKAENELIQAISQGQTHKAEAFMNNFVSSGMESRTVDTLRNFKNYTVILNTLLRKAAETGGVHPLHIDSLSSKFAFRIESAASEDECKSIQREMARKYALLVKNHSMKGYSLLVRKVLTRIDSDLTADLSLKSQADLLQVNASYLSTLFKKETGSTLTEYVNRKRVEHALFLLNSTNMQIQLIAQYCGIPDVNYFTKTFKKLIGKTPKEYRDVMMF